jgi:hypothetical protein
MLPVVQLANLPCCLRHGVAPCFASQQYLWLLRSALSVILHMAVYHPLTRCVS